MIKLSDARGCLEKQGGIFLFGGFRNRFTGQRVDSLAGGTETQQSAHVSFGVVEAEGVQIVAASGQQAVEGVGVLRKQQIGVQSSVVEVLRGRQNELFQAKGRLFVAMNDGIQQRQLFPGLEIGHEAGEVADQAVDGLLHVAARLVQRDFALEHRLVGLVVLQHLHVAVLDFLDGAALRFSDQQRQPLHPHALGKAPRQLPQVVPRLRQQVQLQACHQHLLDDAPFFVPQPP